MLETKEQKMIDLDERSNPLMTLKTVKYYCEREGLFTTPQHNDKLYLQYKGFLKIIPQTMGNYRNLVALWLNNNGISKIEGLDQLLSLTSLALNNNCISKIQGLESLQNLVILNLSHNKIQIVEGLEHLRKLQNINLSHNFIVSYKGLRGLAHCEHLLTLDLSQNQLDDSQDIFQQIVKNKYVSCLYLKSTPLARSFKNYRKRLIAALKSLKFLDDRPVLQQDHRLADAWIQGGTDFERLEKQRLNQEKQRKQQQQKQAKINMQNQQTKKSKPQGFIASIKETSIKISNIDDEQQEARIIQKYFQQEKEQIEVNKQKIKQQEEREKARSQYYMTHQTQVIAEKVNEILGKKQDIGDLQQEKIKVQKSLNQKWKPKYQKILETLLLRYKFDFSQVQPSFNMLLSDVNKKLMRTPIRFEIAQLRKIWTNIEKRKRQQNLNHNK